MVRMKIWLDSVSQHDEIATVVANAVAERAQIRLIVRFTAPVGASYAELWSQAYDEVLSYLDIA